MVQPEGAEQVIPPGGEAVAAAADAAAGVDAANAAALAAEAAQIPLAPAGNTDDELMEDPPEKVREDLKKLQEEFSIFKAQQELNAAAAAVPSPLGTMLGAAPTFDGKGSWPKFIRTSTNRLRVLDIPLINWVTVLLVLLTGAAADYAAANMITEDTPWEDFLSIMAAGPWSTKDTRFSLMSRLFNGNLGNGNPLETVTQMEIIRGKLMLLLPPGFWIIVLLFNLPPAFRESLLLSPSGAEWTSYDELRTMVLSKHGAQKSANASTKDKDKDKDKPPRGNGNPWLPSRSKPTGAARPPAPRQDAGAGPSNPNPLKRKSLDGCFGCGSTAHKIGDKKPDGTPVCPAYDENRLRKGKYPMFPKGNGKGK